MLLTYCLVTIQPGKPHGVGMAALLLLSSSTEPLVGMWGLPTVAVAVGSGSSLETSGM